VALELDDADDPVSSETWQIWTAPSSTSPGILGRSLAAILTFAVAMADEGKGEEAEGQWRWFKFDSICVAFGHMVV
jgi:hypothetical protein